MNEIIAAIDHVRRTVTERVIITVHPSPRGDGSNDYSTRGQLFDAVLGERVLVRRSTTPFCDAARVLLADGIDPATRLVMRHAGQNHDALRAKVGVAAGLTVRDGTDGKPRLKPWHPWKGDLSVPVSPPVRFPQVAGV